MSEFTSHGRPMKPLRALRVSGDISQGSHSPMATDEPMVIDESMVIDEPMVSDTSFVTDQPMVSDNSLVTDQPMVSDTSLVSGPSMTSDVTMAFDPSTVSDPSMVTDVSMTVDPSMITDVSMTVDPPTVSNPYMVSDPSLISDQSMISDYHMNVDPSVASVLSMISNPYDSGSYEIFDPYDSDSYEIYDPSSMVAGLSLTNDAYHPWTYSHFSFPSRVSSPFTFNPPFDYFPNLSIDIIFSILSTFSDFKDLSNFIATSRQIYDVYRLYQQQILVRVAKNIIGDDSWEDATKVLVYQHSKVVMMEPNRGNIYDPVTHNDYRLLNKSLKEKFVLKTEYIPQFLKNHDFYKRCRNPYHGFFRMSPLALAAPPSNPGTIPCTFVKQISASYFYKMWVYSFQYGYDDIKTFVNRPVLTPQEISNLYFVSNAIHTVRDWPRFIWNPFTRLSDVTIPYGDIVEGDLFSRMRIMTEYWKIRLPNNLVYDEQYREKIISNPPLYHKLRHHFICRTNDPNDTDRFEEDFAMLNPQKLIEKWNLSFGWEDDL